MFFAIAEFKKNELTQIFCFTRWGEPPEKAIQRFVVFVEQEEDLLGVGRWSMIISAAIHDSVPGV